MVRYGCKGFQTKHGLALSQVTIWMFCELLRAESLLTDMLFQKKYYLVNLNGNGTSSRFSLFHDGGLYLIETSPLICRVNQWTVSYIWRRLDRVKETLSCWKYHNHKYLWNNFSESYIASSLLNFTFMTFKIYFTYYPIFISSVSDIKGLKKVYLLWLYFYRFFINLMRLYQNKFLFSKTMAD